MNTQPQCVIVTGRPGSGKTTLAKRLGQELWMPVVSRDELKEGYVNTFGVRHDQLPAEANGVVTDSFFAIVRHYLASQISVVIEAAFQHALWEPRIAPLLEVGDPIVIICSIDDSLAATRHLQRGLAEPRREFFHGDKRVSLYRATGEAGPPGPYEPPRLTLPTLHVRTERDYAPSLSEIVAFVASRGEGGALGR